MYLQIFQLSNWEVVEQNNHIKCKYFQNDSNVLIVHGVKRSICNKVATSISHIGFSQHIYTQSGRNEIEANTNVTTKCHGSIFSHDSTC